MTKRNPKSSKPKKSSAPKQPKSKRIALWRQLAISEGALTKEEQLRWKANAIAAYKASKAPSAKAKKSNHMLGYALGIRHDRPREPEQPKENLLKQYKQYTTEKNAISARGVGYQNFMSALEQLPMEVQIELNTKLDVLRNKWGDEPVMDYLDTFNLLNDEVFADVKNPYKVIVAEAFVLRLGAALELAVDGGIDVYSFEDEKDIIEANINAYAKNPKSKSRLMGLIQMDTAMEEGKTLTERLSDIFDEDFEDF